jgi:hypothetical protein
MNDTILRGINSTIGQVNTSLSDRLDKIKRYRDQQVNGHELDAFQPVADTVGADIVGNHSRHHQRYQ